MKKNKTFLLLLMVTVLFLSFAVANYSQYQNKNYAQVLSERDEDVTNADSGSDGRDLIKQNNSRGREIEEQNRVREEKGKRIGDEEDLKRERKNLTTGRLEIINESDDIEKISLEEKELRTGKPKIKGVLPSGQKNDDNPKVMVEMREEKNRVVMKAENGEIEAKNEPQAIVSKLLESGLLDKPLSFEAKSENGKVEFRVEGLEERKMFGLFKVALPKLVTIDDETGEIVAVNQSIWTRIIRAFSI